MGNQIVNAVSVTLCKVMYIGAKNSIFRYIFMGCEQSVMNQEINFGGCGEQLNENNSSACESFSVSKWLLVLSFATPTQKIPTLPFL